MSKRGCPLGEDCDLTLAWMMGAEDARDRAKVRIEALTEQLEAARLDAKEAEAYALWLEGKLQKTEKALEGCMIGGNHLVTWLPENHLPADTDPLVALVKNGAGISHDIWCCWRSIMQARATLAELKGDKP